MRQLRLLLVTVGVLVVTTAPAIADGTLATGGTDSLTTMSCPSTTLCVTDYFTTFDPAEPSAARYVSYPDYDGVSCVSTQLCIGAGLSGLVQYDPTTGAAPPAPSQLSSEHGYQTQTIQCESATLCASLGVYGNNALFYGGGSAFSYDPSTGAEISTVSGNYLVDAACPSASECVAVSSAGGVQTWNPLATYNVSGGVPIESGHPAAIACPTATLCVLGDDGGAAVTFDPTNVSASTATRTVVDPGHAISAISCASAAQCTVVDTSGGEATFSPVTPSTATTASLVPAALASVSCPSATECVAGGAGQIEATFDPQSPAGVTLFRLGHTAATAPAPTRPAQAKPGAHAAIAGRLTVGRTLTAKPGKWTGTAPITYRYRWSRCTRRRCAAIAGAARRTLKLGPKTRGEQIRLVVTASNTAGHATAIARTRRAVRAAPGPAAKAAAAGPSAGVTITEVHPPTGSRAASFQSVVPACGCSSRTVIAEYSLATGRRTRTLATVRPTGAISEAASDAAGDLWMTTTGGPSLGAPGTAGGDPEPGTCASTLVRYDPYSGRTTTEWTFPSSQTVGNAIPSPDGQRVAVLEGGCNTSYFNQHIVVIDLRTRHTTEIGADATPCHSLFGAAWNPAGTKLVFPYGPSVLPSTTSFVPNDTCASPRWSRLVEVSALRPSGTHVWTQWQAPAQCSFQAAAFDAAGVVASEGCTTGATGTDPNDVHSGDAYLVQLGPGGRPTSRYPLKIAYEAGDVVGDPANGQTLVSEDEGGNLNTKDYQWVWRFDGHRLRLVGGYPVQGITDIIAQPL